MQYIYNIITLVVKCVPWWGGAAAARVRWCTCWCGFTTRVKVAFWSMALIWEIIHRWIIVVMYWIKTYLLFEI